MSIEEISSSSEVERIEKEEEEEELAFAEKLVAALKTVEGTDRFGTGGQATELPSMPGMVIEGMNDGGMVPLPVNSATAESWKSVAQKAPFGKG